jgi:hypothetical protein
MARSLRQVLAFAPLETRTRLALFGAMGLVATLVVSPAAIGSRSPIGCLKAAGLSSVQFRGGNGGSTGYPTWRGLHTASPFFAVLVQKLESLAAARRAVKDATSVRAVQSGRYMVTGPVRSVRDSGVTAGVAACLSGR